ncbi:MAG: DNA polymerase III subunit epsilon [Pseudomonadales bacterium]|nr:DNA polymerase III subunit epsilon [Pseudomonadales bacterium]
MRQIVLDTETTGLDPLQGHRIVEIGCVEIVNRKLTGRHLHIYLNPEREVDEAAFEIHGLSNEFLQDKSLFAQVAREFIEFINGAELIIHNAPFDVGFLDNELQRLQAGYKNIADYASIIDTLSMARKKHPGQRNNLDALCKRYGVDNSQRDLHGALLDAEILADVYLLMTGGQTDLSLSMEEPNREQQKEQRAALTREQLELRVIKASPTELEAHAQCLEMITKASNGNCLWLK